MSGFRTWLGIMWCARTLEPQDVARWHLAFGDGIDAGHSAQEARFLQPVEVVVQGGPADLAILSQPGLRGEATEVGVEPVAKMPEHDLRRRLQPALLDGPEGGLVANGTALRAGRTRLVKP